MRLLLPWFICLVMTGCAGLNSSVEPETESSYADTRKQLKQLYEVGEAYYKNGQFDEAEAQFTQMLEVLPEEENALYRLGTIAFKKRQFELSAEYFERTISSNPKNQKAHYNLANIRLMQAENHFKYYAALADKDADLSKVSQLIADIDQFNSRHKRKKDAAGSLDALAGALKRQ